MSLSKRPCISLETANKSKVVLACQEETDFDRAIELAKETPEFSSTSSLIPISLIPILNVIGACEPI